MTVNWRDVLTDPMAKHMYLLVGVLVGTTVLSRMIPVVLQPLPTTYVLFVLIGMVFSYALQSRWWLTWMVVTLLWESLALVYCFVALRQIVSS